VTIDCSPEPMQVVGVAERLRMLFTSLIDNAVRYSHSGGRVRITTAVGPQGRPMARIADDGIGIEAENLPHIFDEYYRTVRGALHNKESSGLGLAIVRRIARVHGHGVRVRSRVDAGTTFDVLLDSPTASDSLETRIEGV